MFGSWKLYLTVVLFTSFTECYLFEICDRAFQNRFSNADPDTLAAMSAGGMSPDMMKTAADMMGKMKPEELQKIFEIGASMNSKNPSSIGNSSGFGSSKFPEITPELAKQASDMMSKMSPEEFQRVLKVASSFNGNGTPFAAPPNVASNQRSESGSQFSAPPRTPTADNPDWGENTYGASSRMGQSSSSFPTSTADLQQNMRNSMNDPAMRQVDNLQLENFPLVTYLVSYYCTTHLQFADVYIYDEEHEPRDDGKHG